MQNNDKQQMPGVSPLENLRSMPTPLDLEPNSIRKLTDFIEVVSVVPTGVPKTFWQSIKIYKSGATKRLYVYAGVNGWLYTALT